jgi:hypothetical protein
MSLGFRKSVIDPNLYYKSVNGEALIFILYIDDLFLTIESFTIELFYRVCILKTLKTLFSRSQKQFAIIIQDE